MLVSPAAVLVTLSSTRAHAFRALAPRAIMLVSPASMLATSATILTSSADMLASPAT
jgi:hypothetical protein